MSIISNFIDSLNYLSGCYKNAVRTAVFEFFDNKANQMQTYVLRMVRKIFVKMIILAISILLIIVGFVALPISILLYSPWSNETKLSVGIVIGIGYLASGIFLCCLIFQRKRWDKNFK